MQREGKQFDYSVSCRNSAAQAIQGKEWAADSCLHSGAICSASAGLLSACSCWRGYQQAHKGDPCASTRLPNPIGWHLWLCHPLLPRKVNLMRWFWLIWHLPFELCWLSYQTWLTKESHKAVSSSSCSVNRCQAALTPEKKLRGDDHMRITHAPSLKRLFWLVCTKESESRRYKIFSVIFQQYHEHMGFMLDCIGACADSLANADIIQVRHHLLL